MNYILLCWIDNGNYYIRKCILIFKVVDISVLYLYKDILKLWLEIIVLYNKIDNGFDN